MSFISYIKSRIIPALILLAGLASITVILIVFDLPVAAIVAIAALLFLAIAAAFIWDYLSKRRFYIEVRASLESDAESFYASEFIERPSFYEGQLMYDTIAKANKDMNDRIAAYRLGSNEYREYIESWIHEIKTPIAASRLALANSTNTATTVALEHDLDRIESYIEQALFYSRSTAVEKDYLINALDVDTLVKRAVKKYSRALIDANITPHFENLSYQIYGDSKWLDFILGQIIANAIKYRKPQSAQSEPTILFSAQKIDEGFEASCVILSITDNGIGIPASDMSRIFEKGFTGQNGRLYAKSTGIGLYLCKKLCDKMRLPLSARSEQGKSTTISIGFPLSKMYFLQQ